MAGSDAAQHVESTVHAWLGRVRVVLVGTTHPGNIGSAARAMKTMGLDDLWLVAPERFPAAEATALASGADDVLAAATVVERLETALADCHDVIGTSARTRSHSVPLLDPQSAAQRAVTRLGEATQARIALVFGREHSGLTNEELDHCQAFVRIRANPAYSSLNLAAAVQVLSFCVRSAVLDVAELEPLSASEPATIRSAAPEPPAEVGFDRATQAQREAFVAHAERVAEAIRYLDPAQPGRFGRRLRHLLARAEPDRADLQMLHGVLSSIEQHGKRSDPD